MNNLIKLMQDYPRQSLSIVAGLIILLTIVLIYTSRIGGRIEADSLVSEPSDLLLEDTYITGWSSIDRNSLHIGETVNYVINIVYDPANITPDMDVFERSVDVTPLEKRQFSEAISSLEGGYKKYTLEYVLQAVVVETGASFQLDPAIIYFTSLGESSLQSYQVSSPRIRIMEYYPGNDADSELNGIIGPIRAYSNLTRVLMAFLGFILIAFCSFSIWKFCRKKKDTELTRVDNLWLEYQNTVKTKSPSKPSFTEFERIFTQLLSSQTGIKPGQFWSGQISDDKFWKEACIGGRNIFRNIYSPGKININWNKDVIALLDNSFTHTLSEINRKNLTEPSLIHRLFNEKQILFISSGSFVLGILMLIFTVWPATWIPEDINRFNQLLEVVNNDEYTNEVALEFSDLGESFNDKHLSAVSYYNSGTLMAGHVQNINQDQLLTIGDSFENVGADERIIQDSEDLLEILTTNVDIFRQSELQLRESVRAHIEDENFRRNLELVIKRRKATLALINDLMNTGHIEPAKVDELLDLLESQMALDFELDEGQEAPGYYIGEEF